MADVRIICVREDLTCAERLAQELDEAGVSVADDLNEPALASIILWSDDAATSLRFLRLACEAAEGDCVVASLTPPRTHRFGAAAVIGCSTWRDELDDGALAPLLSAVEALITPKQQRAEIMLPEIVVTAPPADMVFYDGETEYAPPAPCMRLRAARWRRLLAERAQMRRSAGILAAALALVALVGLQVSGPSGAEHAAPAPTAATTIAALYDPVELAELEAAVPELRDETPAPPARLLEPASAPRAAVRRNRGARHAPAHAEAAFEMPEPIPVALLAGVGETTATPG